MYQSEQDFNEPPKKLSQLILILDIKFKKYNYCHTASVKTIQVNFKLLK